ncbi:hypothetical protein K493DRAFT_343877 [Basidiobolus meristosporus CBS 931.73]|uniref:Uncharacterized protein n=1 Tax=Basidiobolus meristosporus CBS 931.73 TaxID=1314790 RepID=A0A1Y1ZCJ5_9FUNG|nr:hypothetical protein K493DRAFT_343877 [Basidiobolus meristosporus CBS 931.73]|eukprot:ORY07697.1 hypothetical protein K493DRAFT_343877 [Basidiobolus meristosporus CBS 931.73]
MTKKKPTEVSLIPATPVPVPEHVREVLIARYEFIVTEKEVVCSFQKEQQPYAIWLFFAGLKPFNATVAVVSAKTVLK